MSAESVRDITRRLLRDLGMTTVFGNPGTTEVPFLTEWPDDFRYVLGLQESVATAMADGFAQHTGAPALVNLHSAGGVGHALGAVFGAYRNRTPMVVLAGQQARTLLSEDPFLGAVDATTFPKPYVKWSVEPARAQDVPAAIARAYQMAMQPPLGPTFVSVPSDDWDQPGEPIEAPAPIASHGADPAAIKELADAVAASSRPAFVAGPGVVEDDAVRGMVQLAERAKAAVWAPPMTSRASFPESHEQFAGFLLPERQSLAEDLSGYDLVVVFGAPAFTYHVFRGAAGQQLPALYVLSDDPEILARAPRSRGISASLGSAVAQLLAELPESARPLPKSRVIPELPAPTTPPAPESVLATVSEHLPDNAILVTEAPTAKERIQEFLPINPPEQDFHSTASGALGYGLPAAVGAAMARPDRSVLALIGDGSSMYGIQALWTAAQESVPLTVLVLDNREYAAVRLLSDDEVKLPGVDLGGIDFVSIANGMGCAARRIEDLDVLRAELPRALAENGPTVLHILTTQIGDRPY